MIAQNLCGCQRNESGRTRFFRQKEQSPRHCSPPRDGQDAVKHCIYCHRAGISWRKSHFVSREQNLGVERCLFNIVYFFITPPRWYLSYFYYKGFRYFFFFYLKVKIKFFAFIDYKKFIFWFLILYSKNIFRFFGSRRRRRRREGLERKWAADGEKAQGKAAAEFCESAAFNAAFCGFW